MSAPIEFDIVVVGAGLVGAGFAAALARAPFRIAVIESRPPGDDPGEWDTRIYAVSPASVRFLEASGAWQRIDPARTQPVRRMRVFGDREAELEFSAYDAGAAELARIVESRAMQRALWNVLEQQPNVDLLCPAKCEHLERADGRSLIGLEDGRRLVARLVVGADGRSSWVRQAAGIAVRVDPYAQQGVVANFACERAHQGTAFQWFRNDGILAWLPLPGNRISIVWSTHDDHARELLGLDAAALARRVEEAGKGALGRLALITPAAGFPLVKAEVERLAMPGLALIGDAAHAVHPLAGQGVNLGFGDAKVLAEQIRECGGLRSPGDGAVLRGYERARQEDILAMRSVTHGLQRLFSVPGRLPAAARNTGLAITNEVAVLKNLLVRHALG